MNKRIYVRLVNYILRVIIRILCRVEGEFNKVPEIGPFILAVNHVNFMDAPLFASHLPDRPLTVLAKEETWDNPLLGALFTLWGGIPIKRGEVDREAFQGAIQALKDGKILAIAPEGTRSGTGILNKGYPGIVVIAQKAKVPILPVAIYGIEDFWHNIRMLKRTEIHVAVGTPFFLKQDPDGLSKEERQETTDEIMHQIAELLPHAYRGYYSKSHTIQPKHLVFTLPDAAQLNG
ncbi:MAG: 1-acyl-sn-glycerol-3-phosphate acyltransferase [Anaerolineaceae bacterium]|nr:1-acyl-sn-glycerol-3-phosphate acyltransferase [Anaerolineaceae bacterium]